MNQYVAVTALLALALAPTGGAVLASTDPWSALGFLEGTWDAHVQAGSAKAQVGGTYSFKPELKHHVLVRRSDDSAGCHGPASFDCEHSDVLYVYQEAENQALKAIYFDNEGHVIHYTVSTPDPTTAVFVSEASSSAPQFQLIYRLKNAVMSGKFQMRMPGQTDWKSYLEWSGAKK